MFVVIGVLVLLLSNFSNNYLEKFEKRDEELDYRMWNVKRGQQFLDIQINFSKETLEINMIV